MAARAMTGAIAETVEELDGAILPAKTRLTLATSVVTHADVAAIVWANIEHRAICAAEASVAPTMAVNALATDDASIVTTFIRTRQMHGTINAGETGSAKTARALADTVA
jgi:hypothetical protein